MIDLIDENLSFSEKAINSSDKNAILPVVAIIFLLHTWSDRWSRGSRNCLLISGINLIRTKFCCKTVPMIVVY